MTMPITQSSVSDGPSLHVPSGVPIALLPVRLETRYDDDKLKIRIYPDAVHVDSHEPDLTAAEIDDGLQYWARVAAAGADATKAAGAWAALVSAYGPERSAW